MVYMGMFSTTIYKILNLGMQILSKPLTLIPHQQQQHHANKVQRYSFETPTISPDTLYFPMTPDPIYNIYFLFTSTLCLLEYGAPLCKQGPCLPVG